jgi:hypothetical protein
MLVVKCVHAQAWMGPGDVAEILIICYYNRQRYQNRVKGRRRTLILAE